MEIGWKKKNSGKLRIDDFSSVFSYLICGSEAMISIIGIGPSRENMSLKAVNTIKAADVIITYKNI